MATPTYTLIDSTVLGSSASSVTFSSIPADYRDLVIVISAKGTENARFLRGRINNNTGYYYYQVAAKGNGSSAFSTSSNGSYNYFQLAYDGYSDTTFTQTILNIFDFADTDKQSPMIERTNRADSATTMAAWRWNNTAAMTSVNFFFSSGNIAAGSTFYLYGIEA